MNTPNIWLWLIFGTIVLTMLFLDLFVFHKKSEEPKVSDTLKICLSYMGVAILFGLFVWWRKGADTSMLFFTGYLVEFSLSMDNIFVISLVFTSLKVPAKYQHRVLFWGVMGAVVMRAIMILLGAGLVSEFAWVLYVFSVFLIYTGVKMLKHGNEDKPLTEGALFKFIESKFHVSKEIDGEHFVVKKNGKTFITPLLFALIIVELMDVIFAVDSIPAIFLITQDIVVIYTSNIFAILGLRSLYFLLAAAVCRFVYLKPALAIILVFIGSKIFLHDLGLHIPSWMSLMITFAIIAGGIITSLVKTKHIKEC